MDKIEELLKLLARSPEQLVSKASKAQNDIYAELLREISLLDSNASGIAATASNMAKIARIKIKIKGIILDEEYTKAVNVYFKDWAKAEDLMNTYLAEQFSEFEIPKIINELRKQSISITKTSLLDAGIDANVVAPLGDVLTQSVSGNATFKDTTESIRQIILGGDGRLGRLERYVGQIATDAANQYVSNYNLVISNDLNLKWFLYRGGLKDTSRSFCQARAGKYFTKKEVESWGSLNWDGRIPGTNASNIFINRGGFRCDHILIPVSEQGVPLKVRKAKQL